MDVFAQITGESQIFLALTVAYQATALPELFFPVFLSIFDGLVCVKEYFSQSPSSYLFHVVTLFPVKLDRTRLILLLFQQTASLLHQTHLHLMPRY